MKPQSRAAMLLSANALAGYLAFAPTVTRASACCDVGMCTAYSQCFDSGFCALGTNNMCYVTGNGQSGYQCSWVQSNVCS